MSCFYARFISFNTPLLYVFYGVGYALPKDFLKIRFSLHTERPMPSASFEVPTIAWVSHYSKRTEIKVRFEK